MKAPVVEAEQRLETQMAAVEAKLQAHGYKPTRQRREIIRVLLANQDEHLSADELFHRVHTHHPEIGFATIYRTLDLLCQLQILHKLRFEDGFYRFEFNPPQDRHRHHHLICLRCGKVIECAEDRLETLEQEIAKDSGFQIVDHQVKFYGYCAGCRQGRQ